MAEENPSQSIAELSKQSNRLVLIATGLQILTSLITLVSFLVVYLKRKKPSLTVQILKKKEAIAKLDLELATLRKQADYEAKRTRLESDRLEFVGERNLDEQRLQSESPLKDLVQKGSKLVGESKTKLENAVGEKIGKFAVDKDSESSKKGENNE